MPGPLQAAGAISNPTRYAALTMQGEQFTGMCTQRSPYRDALTAYLVKKFYGGSRFDSIWDGINREISAKLTDVRRPGSAVYNAIAVPPVNSYFSWKYIQNGTERVRVLADHTDGGIRDITAGQVTFLMPKTFGSGRARFMNLGSELFIGDGLDQKKILDGKVTWQPSTPTPAGTLISTGSPGTMQMALGGLTMNIAAVSSDGVSTVTIFFDLSTLPAQFANLQGVTFAFAGLTTATFLNGNSYPLQILSSTLGIATVVLTAAAQLYHTDTGTAKNGNGITGGSGPVFSAVQYGLTADSGQVWKCYGPALQNWGVATPLKAPVLTQANGTRYWQANATLAFLYSVLDPSLNVQVATVGVGGQFVTGRSYPSWTPATTLNPNPNTIDGTITWTNYGKVGKWVASTVFATDAVILDSNFNLQYVSAGGGGSSGGSAPAWASVVGTTTTDGALTWTCLGVGAMLTTASISYCFALHGIDGSISTASPTATIQGPILGYGSPAFYDSPVFFTFQSTWPADAQLDKIYIYRTPQGQSPLILEDQVPIDNFPTGGQFYNELGVTDTSTNGNGALSAFVQAAIAHLNDPPPVGFTGPVLHLNRSWGFIGNLLYYSNGPDTIPTTSNGLTGFPPENVVRYQAGIVKLVPITVQNGGLLVFSTSGIFIVLGLGTASNPFYSTQFCSKINLAGYDSLDVLGTEIFLMEANAKVSSLAIEYPFNPQSGYTEIGFPIGDQFKKVTTGGFNASLFTPATAYLSWNVQGSGETAMYVADGGGHWFRMSNASVPESGLIWSPIASIAGGSTGAIQSVETSPGIFDLLIPAFSSANIISVVVLTRQQGGVGPFYFLAIITLDQTAPPWTIASFSGLTNYTVLNGQTLPIIPVTSLPLFGITPTAAQFVVFVSAPTYGPNADTGTVNGNAGPILKRDTTGAVYGDNGTPYPSWDAKGVNLLCSTGQWAEVVHISTKSAAVGARPIVSVLLGEIAPSLKRPWTVLEATSPDPANTPRSESVYSDRYSLAQCGEAATGDCILTRFDYGSQAVADELLDWGIYASTEDERKEEAQK